MKRWLNVLTRRGGERGAILSDAGKCNFIGEEESGWITHSRHSKAYLTSQMAALHRGIRCSVPYAAQSTQEMKHPNYKTLRNFAVTIENHASDPSCKIQSAWARQVIQQEGALK